MGVGTGAIREKMTWTYFAVLFFWAGSHTDPAALDKACSCVVFPVFLMMVLICSLLTKGVYMTCSCCFCVPDYFLYEC